MVRHAPWRVSVPLTAVYPPRMATSAAAVRTARRASSAPLRARAFRTSRGSESRATATTTARRGGCAPSRSSTRTAMVSDQAPQFGLAVHLIPTSCLRVSASSRRVVTAAMRDRARVSPSPGRSGTSVFRRHAVTLTTIAMGTIRLFRHQTATDPQAHHVKNGSSRFYSVGLPFPRMSLAGQIPVSRLPSFRVNSAAVFAARA
jgi:hypothetical protein